MVIHEYQYQNFLKYYKSFHSPLQLVQKQAYHNNSAYRTVDQCLTDLYTRI